MRFLDITAIAFRNFQQRKGRTALNLIGVVIGCIALLLTAAGTNGVSAAFQALFDTSDFAREISVHANGYIHHEPEEGTIVVEGEMSDERRERLTKLLTDRWRTENQTPGNWRISLDQIEQLKSIEHVERVIPQMTLECIATVGDVELAAHVLGIDAQSRQLPKRLIAGELLAADDHSGVLVDELFAYRLGYRSDADLSRLIGKDVSLVYQIKGERIGSVYQLLTQQQEVFTSERRCWKKRPLLPRSLS